MVDHRSEFGSGQQPPTEYSDEHRRVLELQLLQVRREASAARLEAQAAKIEILLRKWCGEWPDASVREVDGGAIRSLQTLESARDEKESEEGRDDVLNPTAHSTGGERDADECDEHRESAASINLDDAVASSCILQPEEAVADRDHRRRSRPAGVMISAAIHGGLLFVLAFVSLQSRRPMDQVSLTAVSAEASTDPMATFSVEASEPTVEPSEPVESQVDVDLANMAEIPVADVSMVAAQMPSFESMMTSSARGSSALASVVASSRGSVNASSAFCGVEGGGNHFVYLVDSSKSMGKAFGSARSELLRAIDSLQPDQRFYVIFFDANPDYMRVVSSDVDDSTSVLASAQNKLALKRWAMQIGMDDGRAPYDPLRFALNLGPDVIFLLSDGEFPAKIEALLQDENRIENLFGDQQFKSIVHTIGYHSRAGEDRMRRIATQNQGQYRYVPGPKR